MKKAHERSHYRFTGYTRHFLRNGFNGLLRALPGDEFVLSPSPADSELIDPVGPISPPPT
jgi:hypothetical protein